MSDPTDDPVEREPEDPTPPNGQAPPDRPDGADSDPPKEKKPSDAGDGPDRSAPGTDRDDVDGFGENRDRVVVGDGGVVYLYCDISAETFTGRDTRLGGESGLYVAPVPPDHLRKLADVYVPPTCVPDAVERLRVDRVISLHGPEGVGRTTTGIQVLRDRVSEKVWQIRPHTPVADLSDAQLAGGRGYFMVLRPDDRVTEFDQTRLRGLCEERGTFLVLIGSVGQIDEPGGFRVAPPPAGLAELLFRHATRVVAADRRERVREVLARPELVEWCRSDHPLADLERVGAIVADVVLDRIAVEDLAGHLRMIGSEQIRRWFDDRPEARPLMITLGYFGGLPLQTLTQLENRLCVLLREEADDTTPRDLFSVTSRGGLADVQARVETVEHDDSYGSLSTQIVEYADRGRERGIVDLLRSDYPAVRPALIKWLREMAVHPDPHVRMRAALRLGTFAEHSLHMLLEEVVLPWAEAGTEKAWQSVAGVLTAPLADPALAPRITRLLNGWVESRDRNRIGAAAMVYALAVAPDNPRAALSGLIRIARRPRLNDRDPWVVLAARGTVVMYMSNRVDARDVLEALRKSAASKKAEVREYAMRSFLIIGQRLETKVAVPGGPVVKRQTWPSLLHDVDRRDTHAAVAALLRDALGDPAWNDWALDTLRGWFIQADRRRYLDEPLARLIRSLAVTRGEADRLAFHLREWTRKEPDGAAARVSRALRRPGAYTATEGTRTQ